jgi:hypothetical protein
LGTIAHHVFVDDRCDIRRADPTAKRGWFVQRRQDGEHGVEVSAGVHQPDFSFAAIAPFSISAMSSISGLPFVRQA